MKNIRRLSISLIIALIGVLTISTAVFGAPANVTGFVANPSNTSIIISWQPATGATSYNLRYRTDTTPTGTADGTQIPVAGTNTMVTLSGLTAGQTYYFAIWGYDGASYSPAPATVATTTLAVTIPSGAQITIPAGIPVPTIPPNATQNASIASFNLRPFTDIIAYSNNSSYGGLGMPINNLWEVIFVIINVGLALLLYIKMKNFLLAYIVMVIISMIGVGLHLLQGYIIPAEILVGLGVWALERYFQ